MAPRKSMPLEWRVVSSTAGMASPASSGVGVPRVWMVRVKRRRVLAMRFMLVWT